jgi:hypothetical protein
MKSGIKYAIAASAYTLVESTNLRELKLPGLSFHRSDIKRSLQRVNSGNVCSQDMDLLANDPGLSNLSNEMNVEFDADFELNVRDYCTGRKVQDISYLECSLDYGQFSSDYKSKCLAEGGEAYEISLFMTCSGAGLDLEMQLSHIPACVGWTCDLGEIYGVVLDAVKVAEASVAGTDDDLECSIYHDYEDISAAPNTITIPSSLDGSNNATNGSRYRSSFVPFAISVGLGLFLMS